MLRLILYIWRQNDILMDDAALNDIYMSIGNTFELENMLDECMPIILKYFKLTSFSLYKTNNMHELKLIYSTECMEMDKENFEAMIKRLEHQYNKDVSSLIVEKVKDTYYYLFILKGFEYLLLWKHPNSLDNEAIALLKNISIKLQHAIYGCKIHDTLHEVQNNLEDNTILLNTIIDTVPLSIFWKDVTSTYLGGNKLFLKDAQCKNIDHLRGKNDYQLPWSSKDAQYYRAQHKKVLGTGVAILDYEEPYVDENGMERWASTSLVPLKNTDGKVFGLLGTYYDITLKKESEYKLKVHRDALAYQATHDSLTGLPSRSLFMDRLKHAIYFAKRNESKVAVLFIDIDKFKNINDSYGHPFGDLAIKKVAKRIRNNIRTIDTVARFGGDEFIVLLDNIVEPSVITTILSRIVKSLETSIVIHHASVHISLSIGITLYPDDAKTSDELLINSDMAMYEAKKMGRNNYQYYTTEMMQRYEVRRELELKLHNAIENKEFTLFYQPKFKLGALEDTFIGMEALIRWKDMDKNIYVPPTTFIPIAEETGIIIPLGEWIMEEGMSQIVSWYKQGFEPGTLALNFSMMQLQENDFLQYFQNILKTTGCKPEWIEIEITESQIMKSPETTIKILNSLHEIGIKIAMDDFGTGYSSLSYLKRLPLDILKIDKLFIDNIIEDKKEMDIVQGILALAKNLKLTVIAEGVEKVEQRDILFKNGCQYIQGYYYTEPLSAEDVEKYL